MEFFDKESGYWLKPKGARNEPLDTAVYALWASLSPAVKADVIRESQWEALERQFQPVSRELFVETKVKAEMDVGRRNNENSMAQT
ncbi:terminase gpA endonuclease subunit [Xanthomonas arboricola]|uniref:terminase gpA endonuclease subunit n=1 Tax=Xanthomonas arboricola TaxID=56448 RepID=UPI001EE91A7E|nr:terminase gpA endonuclease subunit [Xanthomonas arboricola]